VLTDPATLARLFAGLEPYKRVALAVSGGPDSMALMLLFARHGRLISRFSDTVVLTVDHGLRASSADEALDVARRAEGLGFSHETLVWQGPKPATGIQAAARAARYALLAEAARRHGCDVLAVAHTEDDQAETFLLALARGSGVYGLAGMPATRDLGGLTLIRPLLQVAKADLVALLRREGEPFAKDPSNLNERYARARLRRQAADLGALGLTSTRLAATATHLARAAEALDAMADRFFRTSCLFRAGHSIAELDPRALAGLPEEIALRVLSRCLVLIGDLEHPPRLERVEALRAAVLRSLASGERFKRTAGGVVALFRQGPEDSCLCLFPEMGRTGFGTVALQSGATVAWGPYRLRAPSGIHPGIVVEALGPSGARLLRKSGWLGPVTPDRDAMIACQPGLFLQGELVAAPTLQFVVPGQSDHCVVADHRRRADFPLDRSNGVRE
jgi:tRNA(Ile)-lysidine synthase